MYLYDLLRGFSLIIIIRKKNLVVRNPLSTRPWQHVLEPVSGYLLLGKKLFINPRKFSGSWNFGPSANEVKNVKEVAKIIISHIEKIRCIWMNDGVSID